MASLGAFSSTGNFLESCLSSCCCYISLSWKSSNHSTHPPCKDRDAVWEILSPPSMAVGCLGLTLGSATLITALAWGSNFRRLSSLKCCSLSSSVLALPSLHLGASLPTFDKGHLRELTSDSTGACKASGSQQESSAQTLLSVLATGLYSQHCYVSLRPHPRQHIVLEAGCSQGESDELHMKTFLLFITQRTLVSPSLMQGDSGEL